MKCIAGREAFTANVEDITEAAVKDAYGAAVDDLLQASIKEAVRLLWTMILALL